MTRSPVSYAVSLGLISLTAALGCRPGGGTTAQSQALVSAFGDDHGQACEYVSSLSRPYVVGWDEIKLNDLQRAIVGGSPLAVRYEGCSLEMLPRCATGRGHYNFSRAAMTMPQVVELRDASEAVAHFQLGGLGLEGYFDTYDRLQVTRALGGTWEVTGRSEFFDDELSGPRCTTATHVVAAVDVGAYRVDGARGRAGGARVSGGVNGARAGIGGQGASSRTELSQRGDPRDCEGSAWGAGPTDSCNTPLRLTLQPVLPAAERESQCPWGMQHVPGGRMDGYSMLEFCLDTTEVTVDEYRKCVEAGDCDTPSRSRYGTWREPEHRTHPVTDVDWYDAVDFCEYAGKRLPTAQEWQWAARGRDDERPHPWGSLPPTSDLACWNRADGRLGTCAAGERALGASRDGLLDLAGNVSEWTASSFEGSERQRVLMGGSWRDEDPRALRVDRRRGHKAHDEGNADVGFRCAAAVRALFPNGERARRDG